MKQLRVKITGTRPLLMHNGALADKLNPWVRKIRLITSKHSSKKTDDDEEELARLEWNGGLYYDDIAGCPVVPAESIEGAIRDGAKASRKGKDAICGITVIEPMSPVEYDGPRGREELWLHEISGRRAFVDRRGAGVQRSRVMRTRPRFDSWSLTFGVQVDTDAIDVQSVKRALIEAGARKGMCDYRPRFGLFTVDEFSVVKP